MRHHSRTLTCAALVYLAAISTATDALAHPPAPPPSKVTLCHTTHGEHSTHFVTITVGAAAAAAHIRNHGDAPGPCPTGGGSGASTASGKTQAPLVPVTSKGKTARADPEPAGDSPGRASDPNPPSNNGSSSQGDDGAHGNGDGAANGNANGNASGSGNGNGKKP